VDSDAPNVKQLSQHNAATLVEQIDQLSKIAGDFSQFANINNVKLERFDISEVLASLVNLYQSDSVLIKWEKEKADYVVLADRTQMNRLFTNLLKNALEAAEERSMAIIQIDQKINGNHLVISLTDNGNGIPADIQQKIFVPNFTTKSSGTGLGLAICRGIVEKANGHISFSTKEGQGTVFIIELPLAVSE
jgi:signal transduction histidine kinase